MIFTQNKYTTWYFLLVNSRKMMTRNSIYTENHHIIPECLGGIDSLDNLVHLTAREHFIAHVLLTKMTTGKARYLDDLCCFSFHVMDNLKTT